MSLLARCLASVQPSGAVIVAIHDAVEHAATLARARAAGRVIETVEHRSRVLLVLGPGGRVE